MKHNRRQPQNGVLHKRTVAAHQAYDSVSELMKILGVEYGVRISGFRYVSPRICLEAKRKKGGGVESGSIDNTDHGALHVYLELVARPNPSEDQKAIRKLKMNTVSVPISGLESPVRIAVLSILLDLGLGMGPGMLWKEGGVDTRIISSFITSRTPAVVDVGCGKSPGAPVGVDLDTGVVLVVPTWFGRGGQREWRFLHLGRFFTEPPNVCFIYGLGFLGVRSENSIIVQSSLGQSSIPLIRAFILLTSEEAHGEQIDLGASL